MQKAKGGKLDKAKAWLFHSFLKNGHCSSQLISYHNMVFGIEQKKEIKKVNMVDILSIQEWI
jgi:hypothetical protein